MSDQDFLEKEVGETEGVGYNIRDESLTQLGALTSALVDAQNEIWLIEKRLKQVKERERKLSQEEIPSLLLQNGLTMIQLNDGRKLEIEEKLHVSLPKKDPVKRSKVLQWVIENGGSDIIKDELTIEDPDISWIQKLKEMGVPYERKKDIHHQSFAAFVRNKLGMTKGSLPELEANDVPEEANLYLYKETKIK